MKSVIPRAVLLVAPVIETLQLQLAAARELFDRVMSITGEINLVSDLACGLNPLLLGSMGLRVRACDISVGLSERMSATRLVPAWCSPGM